MRFHLDEHVAHAIADGLRRRGVDVTSAADAGLLGAIDQEHIDFGLRERRVIFTQDCDFLRIHAQGIRHFGIVYAAQGERRIGEIVHFLTMMDECLEENAMRDRLEYCD